MPIAFTIAYRKMSGLAINAQRMTFYVPPRHFLKICFLTRASFSILSAHLMTNYVYESKTYATLTIMQ